MLRLRDDVSCYQLGRPAFIEEYTEVEIGWKKRKGRRIEVFPRAWRTLSLRCRLPRAWREGRGQSLLSGAEEGERLPVMLICSIYYAIDGIVTFGIMILVTRVCRNVRGRRRREVLT